MVHQDIVCTLRGELSGSDGEHVGPTTGAIGDRQDVGVASWCDRKGGKVVNTDGDTWTFRKGHCDDGPADSQPWSFPRFALQAVVDPPPGMNIHDIPPMKTLQRAQRARGAKMTKDRRVTSLHDRKAHEQGNVDANSLVVQQATSLPQRVGFVGPCYRQCRVTDEHEMSSPVVCSPPLPASSLMSEKDGCLCEW